LGEGGGGATSGHRSQTESRDDKEEQVRWHDAPDHAASRRPARRW
jgi:hypothetical protein